MSSNAGPDVVRDQVGREADDVLRAKYHEYCSAQLADLLLYLTPDEIFLLARRAADDSGEPSEISYTGMVRTATEWLAGKIKLPPFDVWLRDYRAHPDRYEEYFVGLWEAEMKLPLDP